MKNLFAFIAVLAMILIGTSNTVIAQDEVDSATEVVDSSTVDSTTMDAGSTVIDLSDEADAAEAEAGDRERRGAGSGDRTVR